MQGRYISYAGFHKVLQELEKCHKLKADIRKQAQTKVKFIKLQQEKLLEQGRKEGKDNFLQKTASTSDLQGINAI